MTSINLLRNSTRCFLRISWSQNTRANAVSWQITDIKVTYIVLSETKLKVLLFKSATRDSTLYRRAEIICNTPVCFIWFGVRYFISGYRTAPKLPKILVTFVQYIDGMIVVNIYLKKLHVGRYIQSQRQAVNILVKGNSVSCGT